MRAADLHLQDMVDIQEGTLSLYGRRIVLHPMHAFGRFRADLLDTLGWEHSRRLFTRFGFFWGQADAEAMTRAFRWDSKEELLRAGARLLSIAGLSEATILKLSLAESERSLHTECIWKHSGEAEEHMGEIGPAESHVCWKLAGYASGFASYCLDKPVYYVEHTCRARGDAECTAVGKDVDSWGDEIKEHLPFFQFEDIAGRIEQLSRELRQKTWQITRQHWKTRLRDPLVPFFAEGRSDAFYRVIDLADRVAQFDSSVLITGETGVGKEVLARYIHAASARRQKDFVAIDCGAIPESLLEAELFGSRAGSFTGSVRDRVGLFEGASGGTVFLDEVGDIGPAIQGKLLRVVQEREVTRIGENHSRHVDVRLIAATHRDLDDAVTRGTFRSDLLFRLRVIHIEIPPLRERPEDILPLSRHIVKKLAKRLRLPRMRLDAKCVDYLQAYSWPGNVRELENALERAAVLSPQGAILPDFLPPHIVNEAARHVGSQERYKKSLAEIEREHILEVLRASGNSRTRAAEILGISPVTLWRRLKQIRPENEVPHSVTG